MLCMVIVTNTKLFEVGLHVLAQYMENMACLGSSEVYRIGSQIVKPLVI